MHGLILAGGEGSRLSADGVNVPKPLVRVAGEPLVIRLLALFASLGCETLTCMVREDLTDVFQLLERRDFGLPLVVRPCATPSSLHTLAEGLQAVPAGPVFCTMVDTVMLAADWHKVYAGSARGLAGGADAMLVVTQFVDDESPVYVSTDDAGLVQAVSDIPLAPVLVTGGVYGFSAAARVAAAEAVGQGVQRMRGFLKWLVARGNRVGTLAVSRIIDIDHLSDLRLANAWLGSPEAQV
jgi:NDP-sugar pyrophosphorylase family protein